jgi:flagellar basal-body rod protein FlgF
MDRMIFLAMTGAKHLFERQAVTAHNLANAATAGYRAETGAFRATYVQSPETPTRTFAIASTPGADFTPGPMQSTGRTLDVAIEGKGWFAVEAADGSEAYTRNGSLQTSPNGLLQTRNGQNVLGDAGPITIPADTEVSIGADGTVSTVPTNNQRNQISPVGRMKLVNPDEALLERGADGLFRLRDRSTPPADARVKLASGTLEGSNVNVAEAVIDLIAIARQFEMQMKLLQDAESNSRQAAQLLSMNR